jgi:uncharacterized membrane protein
MFPEIIPNWHPIFVHFTIALYTVSTILIVGSLCIKNNFKSKVLEAGYINLWLGCLFTFITVSAGFYAYNTVAHDAPSHAAMTDHRNWAFVTASIFLILTLWSIKLYYKNKKLNLWFVGCLVLATSLLAITGWKGSEVVYRYGLGVMSLPNIDAHKHMEGNIPENHEGMEKSMGSDTHKSMMKNDGHNHTH